MEIDTASLDPAEAAQIQMFSGLVSSLPTEGLEFFITLLQQELEERKQRGI